MLRLELRRRLIERRVRKRQEINEEEKCGNEKEERGMLIIVPPAFARRGFFAAGKVGMGVEPRGEY